MQGKLAYACGQCLPCRINRRRLWTHRMILESMKHGDSCFVTLTYDDDHLPEGSTLVPKDTQDFLKRLRWCLEPRKLRYFLVGEYGDETQRPHYHAAFFGIGVTDASLINEAWGKGHTFTGVLTEDSAQYVAGYVCKKMTNKDDPRLKGRYPEFARMSRRPGIAAVAIDEIANVLDTKYGKELVAETGDVPQSLKYGRKSMPLGRYLRGKLREKLGAAEEFKTRAKEAYALQMCELFKNCFDDPQNRKKSYRAILVSKNKQKVLNLESRTKIFSNKKGKL